MQWLNGCGKRSDALDLLLYLALSSSLSVFFPMNVVRLEATLRAIARCSPSTGRYTRTSVKIAFPNLREARVVSMLLSARSSNAPSVSARSGGFLASTSFKIADCESLHALPCWWSPSPETPAALVPVASPPRAMSSTRRVSVERGNSFASLIKASVCAAPPSPHNKGSTKWSRSAPEWLSLSGPRAAAMRPRVAGFSPSAVNRGNRPRMTNADAAWPAQPASPNARESTSRAGSDIEPNSSSSKARSAWRSDTQHVSTKDSNPAEHRSSSPSSDEALSPCSCWRSSSNDWRSGSSSADHRKLDKAPPNPSAVGGGGC
mmetsp:Transcript_14733/g.44971  ORF Transcript_14733/g.44971 Transcript_14733/m.44971 type:complete len:318 (+) Transcript_14733:214-1167(+)